jgi:hypothetical protein
VLPRNEDLPSGDPLESHLWSGRNVQSQFVYQDFIWGLTDLIGTVQKPESRISTSEPGKSETAWPTHHISAQRIVAARKRAMTPCIRSAGTTRG